MRFRTVAAMATVLVLAAAAAGCARRDAGEVDGQAAAPADTAFVADGAVGAFGDSAGDARSLAAIVFANTEQGQRVVLTFADAEGLPAKSVGHGRVELKRGLGVVRVWLPAEVDAGAMTETFWAGELASDAFLVRALDGGCYVDVHLRRAAVARVWEPEAPAAIVLELRAGGDEVPEAAPRDRQVVLLAPRAGEATYPLEITGYARTFESNVELRLMQGERAVRDTFATAADYVFMWGEYRLTLPAGPAGVFELHAGTHSARDGSWSGVRAPLVFR